MLEGETWARKIGLRTGCKYHGTPDFLPHICNAIGSLTWALGLRLPTADTDSTRDACKNLFDFCGEPKFGPTVGNSIGSLRP